MSSLPSRALLCGWNSSLVSSLVTGLISFLWLGTAGFPDSFLKSFCTMSLFSTGYSIHPLSSLCFSCHTLRNMSLCVGVRSVLSSSGMPPDDYSCLPRTFIQSNSFLPLSKSSDAMKPLALPTPKYSSFFLHVIALPSIPD